jgi:hypothetical protein
MNDPPSETASLVERFRVGDSRALADLFQRHRDPLRRMVELRMDARIEGRVDFTSPAKFSLTNRRLIIALDPGCPEHSSSRVAASPIRATPASTAPGS